ncbi:hypothetical protein P154DRAFT_520275 [Amniculicola lignicola CBS 123094]|uniref:Arylformamidase n=1 Tax=Amniculicola lignicola CBS 123094 TaxID=1392246 RepID=A0A6A5WT06_9PLEO|nr:hypothetical protein P154DRAFT_520275 [Amniculicola lignicola CBS 123094]
MSERSIQHDIPFTTDSPAIEQKWSLAKRDIPYTDPPTRLQTLDLFLPRPIEQSDPEHTVWIIYVHGGAWRDPEQTSRTVEPTLNHLNDLSKIAGIASINYRFSPYINHPTSPSDPSDPDRNVTHPAHIQDVHAALLHLQDTYGVGHTASGSPGYPWIGVGHSCGATLLCQLASHIGLSDSPQKEAKVAGPAALALFAGIYDIPLFYANHKDGAWGSVYPEIVQGAFGPDTQTAVKPPYEPWVPPSPISGKYERTEWPEGKLVVMVHSDEDELVEWGQVFGFQEKLVREEWKDSSNVEWEKIGGDEGGDKQRGLVVRKARGAHDWVWEDGRQIAVIIGKVVAGLF